MRIEVNTDPTMHDPNGWFIKLQIGRKTFQWLKPSTPLREWWMRRKSPEFWDCKPTRGPR